MSYSEKHIVDAYALMMEGLSPLSKRALIEKLLKSIDEPAEVKNKRFLSTFGAWPDDEPAEETVQKIRESRRFTDKDISF